MSESPNVQLSDVPGLGPVRREALAEVGVTDLQGLLAMKVSELAAVRGIGVWQARKVREYLRNSGLLVEGAQADGADEDSQPIVVHAPETEAEALAVAEVSEVLEAQAAAEAEVAAEVEFLSEALEMAASQAAARAAAEEKVVEPADKSKAKPQPEPEDDDDPDLEEKDGPDDEVEPENDEGVDEDEDEDDNEDEGEGEEESGEVDPREELAERRERLPEVALTLIEAIRQAAVNKQLTRQVTRLLITSGEFVSNSRTFEPDAAQAAVDALAQAESLLQKALEKEAFSDKAQRELAERIRKRRKALDRLLEGTEVEDR